MIILQGPRCVPALQVGSAWISIQLLPRDLEGRHTYRYWIDAEFGGKKINFMDNDMKSGCQGGSIREGFSALLSFLSAFAEAIGPRSDNFSLFPAELRGWAEAARDEISLAECALEEKATN